MKTTTLSCLLTVLSSATVVLAGGVQIATERNLEPLETPVPVAVPEVLLEAAAAKLELREIVNAAPTQAPMQVPSITVQMLETSVPGATGHTWLPFTYTQTFKPTPDPWPQPQAGTIGLGTLTKTKDKREAEPTPIAAEGPPTLILIPFEMVVRNVKIEQPVFQVREMEVIQPVTVTHFVYGNATSGSGDDVPTTLSTTNSVGSVSRMASTTGLSIASSSLATYLRVSLSTTKRGVLFDSPHREAWASQLFEY